MDWTYENIKELAKDQRKAGNRCTIKDLLALAVQNDPFYSGAPAMVERAEWFARLWDALRCVNGSHLRRVHYRLITQEQPYLLPNGSPYENTDECWFYLAEASKHARYLDLVPASAFIDRRNSEPIIYLPDAPGMPGFYIEADDHNLALSMPGFPDPPRLELSDYNPPQPYHLEIWCEKSTINDVLLPICEARGVNLCTFLGECTTTSCLSLVERVLASDRPCRLFYISDFDPAGRSIPVAGARKIEYFTRKLGYDIDIKVFPIALTPEQCVTYRLPRTPIKKEERRGATFEARYGEGATELDALESLHEGELRKIVLRAINHYHDAELIDETDEWHREHQQYLDDISENVVGRHSDDIDRLAAQYAEIKSEFKGKIWAIADEIRNKWQAIQNELETTSPVISDPPQGEMVDDLPDPLLDTNRKYMDQMAYYKAFQRK